MTASTRNTRRARSSRKFCIACGLLSILIGALAADAQAASSVTAAGVTFTFDRDYNTGYYVDGMPWAVESSSGAGVVVTRMTPDFSSGRNGWEENPVAEFTLPSSHPACGSSVSCQAQSLDSRLELTRWAYLSPATRFGSLPRKIPAGTSVLKVESCSGSNCPASGVSGTIISAAVLTVLASPPPPGAIRPPYMGNDKPHFVTSGLDIGTYFPNLPKLSSGEQYSHSEVRQSFGNFPAPSNVFLVTEFDGRATPAKIKMIRTGASPSYGCDYGMWLNAAMLSSAQVGTVAEKKDTVYQLISNAVDHYYATRNGKSWGSGGCIHHGRKSLIMWGGKILNSLDQGSNQSAAASMAAFRNGVDALDQMTYTSTVTGEALWGQPPCTNDPAGDNTTNRHCDQRRDGGGSKVGTGAKGSGSVQDTPSQQVAAGKYSYAAYQMMSAVYFGAATVARVFGFESEWNAGRSDRSDAFFRYVDRIAAPPWSRKCHSHCDSYLTSMFKDYGCNSSTCASNRGSSAPPPPGPSRLPPPDWQ